jgi:hypothetical protein
MLKPNARGQRAPELLRDGAQRVIAQALAAELLRQRRGEFARELPRGAELAIQYRAHPGARAGLLGKGP